MDLRGCAIKYQYRRPSTRVKDRSLVCMAGCLYDLSLLIVVTTQPPNNHSTVSPPPCLLNCLLSQAGTAHFTMY
jgi:hypothetical protein